MFCTITPSRGDRPEFLQFCKYQIARMEVKPDKSYFIDHKPWNNDVDLIPRIQYGIEIAKEDGFDNVMILEDDDAYPADYFNGVNQLFENFDFIGSDKTIYYNLKNKTYQDIEHHPRRSSLFTTGFKISALDKFVWPSDKEPFLDISLWLYAAIFRKKVAWRETKAIGIKHGVGLCGGRGHVQFNKHMDLNSEWLKSHVDEESFKFYKSLSL